MAYNVGTFIFLKFTIILELFGHNIPKSGTVSFITGIYTGL
jgi:hypothetical protein